MLHAAATGLLADVENKGVVLEGRSIHELQLILTDSLQVVFDLFLPPVVAMNHDGHGGRHLWQFEYINIPNFNRTIRERVIARRFESIRMIPPAFERRFQ